MATPVTASELILESPNGSQCRIRLGDDGFVYIEDMNGNGGTALNLLKIQAEPDES